MKEALRTLIELGPFTFYGMQFTMGEFLFNLVIGSVVAAVGVMCINAAARTKK